MLKCNMYLVCRNIEWLVSWMFLRPCFFYCSVPCSGALLWWPSREKWSFLVYSTAQQWFMAYWNEWSPPLLRNGEWLGGKRRKFTWEMTSVVLSACAWRNEEPHFLLSCFTMETVAQILQSLMKTQRLWGTDSERGRLFLLIWIKGQSCHMFVIVCSCCLSNQTLNSWYLI